MSRERWQEFIVNENQDGTLQYLAKADDQNGMNWIGGEHFWGSVICPEGIEIKRKHNVLPNGNLQENIEFLNVTDFPIFFSNTDIGIYTPFNDDYKNVSVSMQKRCHTHIFCGQEASYIMALRMGEERLGLGLAITKGSIIGYSTERMTTIKNKMEELSDDRGDFILHPSCECLEPGEKMILSGQFFWFHTMEEFEEKLLDISGFPLVKAEQMTWFVGENIEFDVSVNCSETEDGEDKTEIYIDNQAVAVTEISTGQIKKVHCSYPVSRDGEYRFRIQTCGRVTEALFYGCVELDRLIRNRCQFIVEKQQHHCKGSHLDGAYLIYDNEEKKQYYSHMRNDHNGARERVGMGALIALWLQKEYDAELMNSLQKYVEYLYREIYDTTTGIVSNDIEHNLELHRMYNYPWMAILQMELYNLTKESKWLKDAGKTMLRYYKEGGTSFYAIGIPVQEIFENMQKEKMEAAQELKKWFLCQADIICKNSTQYPPFEVTFEQSIVAPAVSCLLQAYEITGEDKYIKEAEKQMEILERFQGKQPDYHLYENAIRHWDGYWFGKYRNFGDTFPHYWSTLSGDVYAHYEKITKKKKYAKMACASLRGCLSLFGKDGTASCAMVFPLTVNKKKGNYYDPWANDQDWALYYALKHENIINNVIF